MDHRPLDKEALAKIRKKFDESIRGVKLTERKELFDKCSEKIPDEEIKLKEEFAEWKNEYDYARDLLVTLIYHHEVSKQSKIPSWEDEQWYGAADKALKKGLVKYYRSYLENDEKGSDILKLEGQFKATKKRVKSTPGFSDDVKVLSEELDEKRWQYLEVRVETEEPNKKSNKALESIQKHLEKSIEAMKAMKNHFYLHRLKMGRMQRQKLCWIEKLRSDIVE